MQQRQIREQAHGRAIEGLSERNYATILAGMSAKGIPEADILPRENVFTYQAWQHLGRQVQKGEKGVKIQAWRKDEKTGKSRPCFPSVFHISQTSAKSGAKFQHVETIGETATPVTETGQEVMQYRSTVAVKSDCGRKQPVGALARFAARQSNE